MRAYERTCAEVIEVFDGQIASILAICLLVYSWYPEAHEDDAQRAVRAGLGYGRRRRRNTELGRKKATLCWCAWHPDRPGGGGDGGGS